MKDNLTCVDCQEQYPGCIMEFDHLDGRTKITNISKLVGTNQKMLDELAKCEPVCSNCHRIRTWNRKHPDELIVNPRIHLGVV